MLRRIFKLAIGAVILVIAALFLGAIPISTGGSKQAPSDATIRIFVLSNGFHSDIAIPRLDGQTIQRLELSELDYPVNLDEVRYWAVGWGSKTAYTSLLEISDLSLNIAAKSLAFDVAVMHVTPIGELSAGSRVFPIDLSPEQYESLLANLSSWFTSRAPQEVTQGFGDRFYAAKGKFSPWMTCNSWTGRRLREIGINVGLWTPVSQSLEFGLQRFVNTR